MTAAATRGAALSLAQGMRPAISICESDVPLASAIAGRDVALAVIAATEGAAYRPVGAVMAIDAQGRSWGSLSSGCIEQDVIVHARRALQDGQGRQLRYGLGSPFRDLELPCGGGLDIIVLPRPDQAMLRRAAEALLRRRPTLLDLLAGAEGGPGITLHIQPQLSCVVFGKGPEARCFTDLVAAAGYPVRLFSPDDETIAGLPDARSLPGPHWPDGLTLDARTAVTFFFHDHGWEPRLLQAALASPALFVGAQGSLRAHRARCAALAELGVPEAQIQRLASPFGLVPSARDARTLAVSVLAQVLDRARLA